MTELYHYTCRHRAAMIERDGWLHPNPQPVIGYPLVWATDLDEPDVEALGLTSHTLRCDRSEVRLRVDPSDLEPWLAWCHGRVDPRVRSELAFGRRPARWWVAQVPVRVLDP